MANEKDEEVLGFRVETKIDTALKMMAKFDKDMRQHMMAITKASQKMTKQGVKATKQVEDANEDLIDTIGDLDDAYGEVVKSQTKSNDESEDAVKKIKAETKAISAKAKAAEKARKASLSEYELAIEDPAAAKKLGKTIKSEMTASLKGGFNTFLSKDAKGLVGHLGKLLQGGVTLGGAKAGAAGAGMKAKAKAMKETMSAQEGGASGGMKAMSSVMGTVGKALESFSKFAPILEGVASGLVMIVSLFLDADEAIKGFNKEVLTGGSTIGFLKKNMGDAAAAGSDLDDTLNSIQESANDWKFNTKWGTVVEDHKNVLSALKAEGVGLDTLQDQADKAGKSVGGLSQEIVATSVAYSRNLGVSLQEISQLQGEMFTEMGMNADMTAAAFSTISSAAADSGISANKFFGILRGMSSDLSLFNLRIEEAAKFLKQVSKTMSPKMAQQFMNAITQHFKSMDIQTRLKSTLVAGASSTKKNEQESLERSLSGLTVDVEAKVGAGSGKEMLAAIKGGPKATAKFIAKHTDKLDTGMKEAIVDAQRQTTLITKGGLVGLASAMRKLDPMGVMEQLQTESMKRFTKPLEELTGVELIAVQGISGIDDNMLDMVNKFQVGLETTKEELANRIAKGTATQEDMALLQRLGIKSGDKDSMAQAVRDKDAKDIFKNMSKTAQDALTQQDSDRNFAKEQTTMQTTMSQQLGVIVDFLKNQLYGVMSSILDGLMGLVGLMPGSGMSRGEANARKKIFKSQNKDLVQALQTGDFKKGVAGGVIGGKVSTLSKSDEGRKKLTAAASKTLNFGEVASAARMGGVSEDVIKKITGAALRAALKRGDEDSNVDLAELFKEVNVSADDQQKLLSKILWATNDQSKIADLALAASDKDSNTTPQAAPPDTDSNTTPQAAPPAPKPVQPPSPQAAPPAPKPVQPPSPQAAPTAQIPKPVMAPVPAPSAMLPSGSPPGGPVPPVPKDVKDFQDGMLDQLGYLGGKNDDIIQVLKRKVKLDKTFVRDELGPQIQDSVLKAVRVALVEYKLYKDVDTATFAKQMQTPGFDATTYGATLAAAVHGGTANVTGTGATLKGTGNATGGHIIGRNPDGTAKVIKPPAGEMPAFIGKGETIKPRGGGGGGGGNVSVTVNGIGGNDLANMVKVAATNAIYEYKRRENLH